MDWAIIAGGSKGIGLSIAEALAKRKYNLMLVARDGNSLSDVKNKLENQFNIQVEFLSLDLSLSESATIIRDWCISKNHEIKILCNAAGLGGAHDFPDLTLDELRTMIRLNIESSIAICYSLIPLLKKNAPSYILNISSMAGFAPLPLKNVYAATKSALQFFSYSLRYQLKENNISVSCLCPGPVFTKPSIEKETIKQLGWFGKQMAVKTSEAGESAVRGMFRHRMIIVPGKLAGMVSFLLRLLPHRLSAYMFYSFRKKTAGNS